jgi:hypothetical protein
MDILGVKLSFTLDDVLYSNISPEISQRVPYATASGFIPPVPPFDLVIGFQKPVLIKETELSKIYFDLIGNHGKSNKNNTFNQESSMDTPTLTTPSPDEIRTLLKKHGITREIASGLVLVSLRAVPHYTP